MSMESSITPDRIINSIRMDKSFNGVYLIVEGENDLKIYKMIMKDEVVRIRRALGKDKVKTVLKSLNNEKEHKLIGIVDSDFDNILGSDEEIQGLFKTDYHDIETMIFDSKAFEKMVNLLCDENRLKEFESIKKQSLKEIVIDITKYIGKLKLINQEQQLQMSFKPKDKNGNTLKYKKIISDKNGDFLGVDKLIDTVISYGKNRTKGIDIEKLKQDYIKKDISIYNNYNIINGHDISNIVYILLKYVLKSSSPLLKDYTCIEKSLILAYNFQDFSRFSLYKQLIEWQVNNCIQLLNEEISMPVHNKAI